MRSSSSNQGNYDGIGHENSDVIIQGNYDGSVFSLSNGQYHIEGVTIRFGRSDKGGGINTTNSQLMIVNSLIESNQTAGSGSDGDWRNQNADQSMRYLLEFDNNHLLYDSLFYVFLLSFFGTAMAKILFNKLIQISSPVFASSVTYSMLVVSVIWGILDGELFNFYQAVATILIIMGVYLSNKKKPIN